MAVDPFRLAIALAPLSAYALLLAALNFRRRPLVVSGGRDLAALGLALSGVMFVGPIELFRPEAATGELGNFIWPVLLVFYGLLVSLAVLFSRPRLVVYNISLDELHAAVAEAAARLDSDARWAGNHLSLPRLGVQLYLDNFRLMRNASLVASGGQQNIEGWHRLARELSGVLRLLPVKRNSRALGLFLVSVGLLVASIHYMLRHPVELAEAVQQVFAF
jgi:hypothetical protein